ncbi:mucin-2 isoform X2 [Manduca sexta]|uniref:mucin-2 isoform X2 n=1 Tax=Manduca sexta TaxID=7130 RepID=UPI00118427EC|nr:mucin-2 isoform X2 [Manduca sexta]
MGSFDLRSCPSIFKMETTLWLSVILAVLSLSTPTSFGEPRVVCYYTNWSVYRPGTARFNPQNINPYLCTHLIYAFGGFTKDNTLKPFDKYQDIEKGGYAKFTGLKTYNKELKTMLAIGGWNEGSSRFSPMVGSRDRRKEFVRNAIKFLRQNRFDGLDLDWEYPSFRDGGKPKDRENYAKLVRELREEFEREAEKTGKPRLLLTMAVPAGIEYIQKGYDVETLNRYLDWMNLLTYDYHSAFEPAVNHHAPLYPLEEPNEYSVDTELNIDYTIKFYLENGADRNKLVLGIPTYGRSYTLFNADAVEIGSPADGPGEQGDATKEKGYLAYYEICESVKPKKRKRETYSDEDSEEYSESEEEEEDEEWTVMHPNPNAMGPVAYKGNQWVGYDDIDIVKKKAEYVAENGLGGIMFWSIDNDDFRGTCHGKPYPLIEAAKEAYIVKLTSTDNAVAEKPSSSSRSGGRRKHRPKTTKTTTTTTTTTTTPKPTTTKSNKRKNALTSSTPSWNIITPEPPTTPDPGSDFKCKDEGFYPHPRDCKKYFWCLDSGPSNLGIVAHQFTCPSGLYFNKAADSCDFARNVLCKQPAATTKAPTKPTTRTTPTTTTTTTTTTRKPLRISTRNSVLFRTTTTTTTTPEPEPEEEEEEQTGDSIDDAEDPKVIKELIDLIKKVGGIEQLEKQLHLSESPQPSTSDGIVTTTPSAFNKKLYQKVLERTRGKNKFGANSILENAIQNSRRAPQNQGIEPASDKDKLLRKDRPQYTTINRQRPSTSTPEPEEEEEEELDDVQTPKPRIVEAISGTTTKQYVNIRRARPTSDTADDTASRNALFERQEPLPAVSETPNSLDILSARRENVPEYVTIRRQRPTTEETTTVQYQGAELEDDRQQTALEKEISSQLQYTSIQRTRSTTIQPSEEPTTPEPTITRTRPTVPSSEEPSSPEPTTVLAVQISSLLNSLSSEVDTVPETTAAQATEPVPTTTTTLSTTTTTTTTVAPSSAPTRRTVLRRRGPSSTSSTSTTSAPSPTQAPKRSFLRRTKATAPPETTDIVPSESPITSTSRYTTRRGGSKFKLRKELEKEVKNTKNVTENDAENEDRTRRPAPVGGPRRSERPVATRNFARRKPGGANGSTTPLTPSSVSTSGTTRKPFRIAARRRPSSTTVTTTTTTTTTTTPQPTTVADDPVEIEESLQDIGDTDAIEDPSLEPREPKISNKIQRRPLVTLKDESKDQNPSATNEEESKRQSKKYSSSFKQNQLDDILKSRTRQETTTEFKTTIEDISAETALAIATHQLLTAPVPISQNFDDIDPSKTKTTQSYKYTSPQLNEFTDEKTPIYEKYPSTQTYRDTAANDYAQTTSGVFSTQFDTPKLSPTTLEVTDPTTPLTYRTIDTSQRGYSTLSTIPETPEITSTYDVPKTTTVSQSTRYSRPTGFSTVTTEYDSSRISTFFDTASPTATNTFATNPRPYYSTLTTEYETPTITSTYDAPRSTNTFTTKDSRELTYSTGTTDFNTRESSTDFEVPRTIATRRRPTTLPTNPTETVSAEITTSNINVPRSRYTSTQRSNTITQEYFETTRGTFADTPTEYRSRISSTFTTPDPTTTVVTKRSRQRLSSPNVINTGYTGVSERVRSSTPRYVASTERFLTDPVEETSFSTAGYSVSSQEPSYFTREYLLESPVTKTYDDEYQYLSPKTTPQPRQRKIFRKKIQRRISSTIPPTTTTTTTEAPKTTKPIKKVTRPPVKTYKPIVNYDYYDDSEEKLVEKYVAGTKVVLHDEDTIECLDVGNFPHPTSCKKFISCARMESGSLIGWEYICPKGLSFDPVGGICNWSAGLGCDEKDV